ncbi:MAG: DUF4956 domain-containing protein [Clostridia bacterium]|nr:DUF4956 domain-containing protein [Clostridia bacterium]
MSSIFDSVLTGTFTADIFLYCLLASLLCGAIISVATGYRNKVSKGFLISIVLMPAVVFAVITMVNGNIGTGVAVMGAFSLIRFRSNAGKAKDILSIFLAMTCGLACAAGYIVIGILFALVISIIMVLLVKLYGAQDKKMTLNITIPESLEFENNFDDLFDKYTKQADLIKTKTANMGSLYKLQYELIMKKDTSIKNFLDDLRCRNGNLEISIFETKEDEEQL